ncbi:MAG: PhnD/SsuA/transferrin family substrate-binding protein [Actinobacteria bacterium]|nr:PhnD/SsuA/transferrin family substrate-binding protein [Actinomycetota bacterium]
MVVSGKSVAELGFYPFEDVRWAHEELWAEISKRCSWVAPHLTWSNDPKGVWQSDNKFVSQSCGWPLVTRLTDKVRVVGAFRHTTPESASHFYRSVVVGRVDGTPFDFQGSVAVVNETESLSGWISLIAAIHGPQETWRGEVRISGSHAESVRMLHRGEADVASIDSVSLAHLRRIYPELIASLFVICNGPLVPCLPLIAHHAISDSQLNELRQAIHAATHEPNLSDATAALFICGFDSLDLEDYLPLRNLTPNN